MNSYGLATHDQKQKIEMRISNIRITNLLLYVGTIPFTCKLKWARPFAMGSSTNPSTYLHTKTGMGTIRAKSSAFKLTAAIDTLSSDLHLAVDFSITYFFSAKNDSIGALIILHLLKMIAKRVETLLASIPSSNTNYPNSHLC